MPLDFDPVFHTETMVKILRDQGSTQYAMELAELILQKNPQHEGVRRILEELREEARRAFERFKSAGRPAEGGAAVLTEETPELSQSSALLEEVSQASVVEAPEPAIDAGPANLVSDAAGAELPEAAAPASDPEPVRLTLVPPPPPLSRRQAKIRRLEALLRRVQLFRKGADASQA
ncbi:MAG: hypothetical protein U1F66_12820 [bacterium]